MRYYNEFFPSFLLGTLYLSLNWTSALLFAIFLLYLLNICIIIVAIQTVLLRIYYIKVSQIYRFLLSIFKSFNWLKFNQFRFYYTETLVCILRTNEVYSKLLLIHFVVNWSLNLYLVLCVIFYKTKTIQVYFLAFCAANQLVCLFLFNAMWSQFNWHIQRPAQMLFQLNSAVQTKIGDFKSRLTLINYIFTMNTPQTIGFTCGPGGPPISTQHFAKVTISFY